MRRPDVLVIGGGIFGLSVGWAARRAGLSVRVFEAERIGGGASGGPVGALVPHAPGRWSALHAFQLAALVALPARIAEIEAESGMSTGYARPGRLVPLGTAEARARAEADATAAPGRWRNAARWEVLDAIPGCGEGWLSPAAAAHGVVRDSLSARVDPPAYLAALAKCLADVITEGVAATLEANQNAGGPAIATPEGRLAARHVVVAAGWRSWKLAGVVAGDAVKGQAALLSVASMDRPLITAPGLYIVPHGRGVAVGSTSEPRFADPASTDDRLDALVERARALCPALARAPVVERWAGMRPRPPGGVPVVGALPARPGVWIASGGYRIGFGIAHAIADALVAEIAGTVPPIPLPAGFRPAKR